MLFRSLRSKPKITYPKMCSVCRYRDRRFDVSVGAHEEVRAMLAAHLLSGLTSEEVDLIVAEELHLLDAFV